MDPKKLESIHDALTEALAKRIASGDATAADLNVARQFLKDNGIEVSNPAAMAPLKDAVTNVLPFGDPAEERAVNRKSS